MIISPLSLTHLLAPEVRRAGGHSLSADLPEVRIPIDNVTFNSVIFRSSGQDLTTAGTYIEMGSRLLEPILLALAVLAVRGRIKR
ncbi:hypothetical protein STRCI_005798 [Streptomyces cinnabarinus]|uniref:Uncharacterized protein n=1 Tax=Streptomyces cinnabarinus TaxID=67287 RepID=A0ABY7KS08_9ACTN|nr:hypothetical protein [Streptomyces cinnabarinus]WAZ27358.1 hypothetical protein STRCI_005798 [Streptomyces cinnabarinus]